MKRLPILMGAIAASLAMVPASRAANSPPAIADYLNRTPTVMGSVTEANDHSVTLATDSGTPMTFVIDSRSVVPADLPAGTRVRVEFHALSADAFHAGRITPLTAAEIRALEENAPPRMRAASEQAESGSETMSSTEAEATPVEEAPATIETAPRAAAPADETSAPAPEVAPQAIPPASEGATESNEEGQLPRTAGSLPLVAIVGGVALAAAAGIGFLRRRRRA